MMLDRLNDSFWADLDQEYDVARDVPCLLRQLLSSNRQERTDAIEDLFGMFCHQGTVFYDSATATAVPFLYETLAVPGVSDKAEIARLIASIANGTGYYSRSGVAEFEPFWRKILGEEGKTLEGEREREKVEFEAVRRAVSANLSLLLPYLRHEDTAVREEVAKALGNFPEHAEQSLPALQAALLVEQVHQPRWHMRRSLERLTKLKP